MLKDPDFSVLLLIRTRCPDTSSKATLWMKTLHEGALATLLIVRKTPQDPHTCRWLEQGLRGMKTVSQDWQRGGHHSLWARTQRPQSSERSPPRWCWCRLITRKPPLGTLRASIQAIVAKLRTVASLRAEPWAGESGPPEHRFPWGWVMAS